VNTGDRSLSALRNSKDAVRHPLSPNRRGDPQSEGANDNSEKTNHAACHFFSACRDHAGGRSTWAAGKTTAARVPILALVAGRNGWQPTAVWPASSSPNASAGTRATPGANVSRSASAPDARFVSVNRHSNRNIKSWRASMRPTKWRTQGKTAGTKAFKTCGQFRFSASSSLMPKQPSSSSRRLAESPSPMSWDNCDAFTWIASCPLSWMKRTRHFGRPLGRTDTGHRDRRHEPSQPVLSARRGIPSAPVRTVSNA